MNHTELRNSSMIVYTTYAAKASILFPDSKKKSTEDGIECSADSFPRMCSKSIVYVGSDKFNT